MNFHALRFDRAAETYGLHAQVQERMADVLLGLLPADRNGNPSRLAAGDPSTPVSSILEMGCGTGNFTRLLRNRFPRALLLATDAAPRMLASARSNLDATSGIGVHDAAGSPLPKSAGSGSAGTPGVDWALFDASGAGPAPEPIRGLSRFDLAASNAMVQWFPDLRPHLTLVAGLLAPSAAYLVAGFSRDNFPELNAILKEPPFAYADYPGHSEAEIRSAAQACGFTVAAYREEETVVAEPSARAFLESIRELGSVRRPEAGKPLTRSRLRLLLATYQERYPSGEGVRVTWKPWHAMLRKA